MSKIGKQILITGANGFIGKRTVEKFLENGFSVKALVRDDGFCRLKPDKNLSVIRVDICDYDKLKKGVGTVDVVVHLAANKYHPKKSFEVSISGANNLVHLIKDGRVRSRRIINISSQSTKIKWQGVYGKSKSKSDEIIMGDKDVLWTTLKPSLVYGEDKNTIFKTIANFALGLPFIPVIGNGKWVLFPIDVDDLAKMIVNTVNNMNTIKKVYDIGCEKGIKFNDMVNLIQKELGVNKMIINVPVWVGLPGVWLATKIIPSLPVSVDNVLGSNQNTYCLPKKAIKELSLVPLTPKEGIRKYLGRSNKLKVAIVGLGKMGILHASILATMKDVDIRAVIDIDKKLGKTAVSMGFGAKFYRDLNLAIKNEKIEAVFICTPNFNHKDIIDICEKFNVPFLVEKPVVTDYQDWKNINIKGRSMAGYFWVHKREIKFIKALLEKNILGEITNYRVILKHGEVFGKKKGWLFTKKLSGGGVLMNPSPHAFSVIQYLFGKGEVESSNIKYIYGNEVEDEARIKLRHCKITGELVASWSVKNEPVLKIEIEIHGKKGRIIFKDNKLSVNKKIYNYEEIAREGEVFNLNPKSGGDAYYLEDREFIENCFDDKRKTTTSLLFAKEVEEMIYKSYEYAK